MKRLLSATLIASTLALSLGATAASAQSYGRHGGYGHGGYGGYSRGYGGYRHHDNTGALVGLGIGLFALGAIAAASSHDRYDNRYGYDDGYGYGPPPRPAYRYGYRGYGYGY